MNYYGEKCPVCNAELKENDDIAVCPDCGTPCHRSCWQGECPNAHLHGDGFVWTRTEVKTHTAQEEQPELTATCPFCNHENPIDAQVCAYCMQPLEILGRKIVMPEEENDKKAESNGDVFYAPPFETGYTEPENTPDAYRDEGGRFDTQNYDDMVFGTEIKYFSQYIRYSIPSYYRKCKRDEAGKRFSFNFGALIFGYMWFFFRKLYKEGIVFLALSMCVTLALYPMTSKVVEEYTAVAAEVQKITERENSEDGAQKPSQAEYEALEEKIFAVSAECTKVAAILLGCNLIINLVAAFIADRLYIKKYKRDMRRLYKARMSINDGRTAKLAFEGGISRLGEVSFFYPLLAFFASQTVVSLLVSIFY